MTSRYSRLKGFVGFGLLLCLLIVSCTYEPEISFNEEIRPILNDNCLVCHGGVKQLGDFSLLLPQSAFDAAESGKIPIIPGNHRKSELYQRLVHHDPESRMPQGAPALSELEIKKIAQWIDEGAQWEDHWAYVVPQKPELPQVQDPWITTPWDAFVLEKLQAVGLEPATIADPGVLARRVSLDLIGIPPPQSWIDPFLDNPSAEQYLILVDSLLASPHFGERWASMWLDLARYADSNGYEIDNHRNMWRFRDWVINALNQDMPFDQFTELQLAGDLMPQATDDQLIATAFHRNTMTNTEGGTIDEEFRMASVMDRLNTTFELWQSTSIACVQCHSHPYDPFLHQEYYNLLSYFNNTQDADLASLEPTLAQWTPLQEEEIDQILSLLQVNSPSRLSTNIEQAMFPIVTPRNCDDFQGILINGDGSASNQVINLKDGMDHRLYLLYEDVPIDNLTHIKYRLGTKGDDGQIKVYLDQLDGPLLQEMDLPFTSASASNIWQFNYQDLQIAVEPHNGRHDVYIELINSTQKAPDGLINLKYLEFIYDNQGLSGKALDSRIRLLELMNEADRTPIMKAKHQELSRTTRVFDRGSRLTPTDTAQSYLPETLNPQGLEVNNRLELAQWLTSPENPLTARVMVNRFWEQLFGTGIVPTVEDFGTQASKASHPELLDYLAVAFSDQFQWSVKALLRDIVSSSTYRQSSKLTAQKLQLDPYNQWLSRGPRFRLSAEQIRDQGLAVSGLLDKTIGGKSVMPPQPEGIWQVIYSAQKWETTPQDRYRRGLYTYWKRTSPYPSMTSFDSPSRELCVSRRIRTNTPLQALVTLNDPVYVEIANALGTRMSKEYDDPERAIAWGYQQALLQPPDESTVQALMDLYLQAKSEMEQATETEFVHAMAVVANSILNLDGFIMKE